MNGDKFTFTPKQVENDFIYVSSNYAVRKESASGVGAIFKADFTWAFIPYLGIGGGFFANVNSLQSSVGFEFKVVAGWLNSKRVKL